MREKDDDYSHLHSLLYTCYELYILQFWSMLSDLLICQFIGKEFFYLSVRLCFHYAYNLYRLKIS